MSEPSPKPLQSWQDGQVQNTCNMMCEIKSIVYASMPTLSLIVILLPMDREKPRKPRFFKTNFQVWGLLYPITFPNQG